MAQELLDRLEAYYDLVPRANARIVEVGPFTVFVGTGPWPYYARPRRDADDLMEVAHVTSLLRRLRALDRPLELEWVGELRPELAEAAAGAGMSVVANPLLVLDEPLSVAAPADVSVRVVASSDPAIPAARASISVAFSAGGTAVGAAGVPEREATLAKQPASSHAFIRGQIDAGRMVMVVAEGDGGALGGGSATPRGTVAELTGIATLPSARRRGVGLAVTAALAEATRRGGVQLTFMSAASDDVARVYERAGFRRVATACVASMES